MENRFSYALVGSFVIGFLILTLGVSMWLSSGRDKVKYIQYQVITGESVAGLALNSQIDYRGVNIGKVSNISLDKEDPSLVTILLDVDENAPIKRDTTAVLTGKGVTGLVTVSLTGGSAEAERLLPTAEEPIPVIKNGPSLSKRLDEAFDNITASISNLSDQIDHILTPENIERFNRVAENIVQITDDLADATPKVRTFIEESTDLVNSAKPHIETSMGSIQSIIERINKSTKNIDKSIEEFLVSFSGVPENFNRTVKSWHGVAYTTDDHIRRVLPQLQTTLEDLSRLIEKLNHTPEALIRGDAKGRRGPGE